MCSTGSARSASICPGGMYSTSGTRLTPRTKGFSIRRSRTCSAIIDGQSTWELDRCRMRCQETTSGNHNAPTCESRNPAVFGRTTVVTAHRRGAGEGSLTQLPDGRWQARIDLGYVNGKRVRHAYL